MVGITAKFWQQCLLFTLPFHLCHLYSPKKDCLLTLGKLWSSGCVMRDASRAASTFSRVGRVNATKIEGDVKD